VKARVSCPRINLDRRGALRLTCAVGAGALAGCAPSYGEVPSGPFAAGNVKDLAVGSVRVVQYFAIARDEGGVYAMSALCTHAGCPTVAMPPGDLYCPCHGSLFDKNGGVLRGPAHASLPHYEVDIAGDGAITIQGGKLVPPETRVPTATEP
jgi:Rieske Fe-S protein